ncbi:hypothetical protein D3C72_1061870 [compost metagenome]
MTDATMLAMASKAAKREIDRLRRTRVPEYPGSWRTHEGLGWENLDDVAVATTRAVLMAVREASDDTLDGQCFRDMLDDMLADGEGR